MTTEAKQDGRTIALGTGLSIWRGTVSEEYLTDLKPWSRAVKVFREMRDDVVIGALLESIKTPLLAAPFEVHPASQSDEDRRAAEFLEKNIFHLPEMEWREHVEEMLDFIDFGFAIAEKVLEKRKDGRLYLRALIPIGQETLYRWGDPDELGRVTAFEQLDPITGKVRRATMDKLLHFTWKSRKRNPHGHSILRSLYRPWYFKKNLEAIEAIGAERDVGNAPVARLGEGYYSDQDIENLKKALEGFRIDEALYLILPHGVDLQAFGGGGKVYNVRAMIRDWQHLIRQRFFADFLSLGSEQVGTQALAREMTTFFSFALRSIQVRMLEVWNRQLVPWLFEWNNWRLDAYPKIAWTMPGRHSLQALAQAYSTFIGAGILTPDDSIEPQIREELGLPPLSPEIAELRRRAILHQLEKQAGEAEEAQNEGQNTPGQNQA